MAVVETGPAAATTVADDGVAASVGGPEIDSGEDGGVMTAEAVLAAAAAAVTNLKFVVLHVPMPPVKGRGGGGGCCVAEGTARTPLDEDDRLMGTW